MLATPSGTLAHTLATGPKKNTMRLPSSGARLVAARRGAAEVRGTWRAFGVARLGGLVAGHLLRLSRTQGAHVLGRVGERFSRFSASIVRSRAP